MDPAAEFKQQLEVPPASAQRHLLTSNHPQFDSGSDALIHVSSDRLFSFHSTSCLIGHHGLCVFMDGREVKGDVHQQQLTHVNISLCVTVMVENHYRTKQSLLISNMSAMQIKYILFLQPKITITLLQWALQPTASCLPGNRCYLHNVTVIQPISMISCTL